MIRGKDMQSLIDSLIFLVNGLASWHGLPDITLINVIMAQVGHFKFDRFKTFQGIWSNHPKC